MKDIKVGPLKLDAVARKDGQDVKATTTGKEVTKVNSDIGVKVQVLALKLGVSRTNTEGEGQPAKTEWVPGFEVGKFEGTNAEVGVGIGGCFLRCATIEVGIQLDKVADDLGKAALSAVGNHVHMDAASVPGAGNDRGDEQ